MNHLPLIFAAAAIGSLAIGTGVMLVKRHSDRAEKEERLAWAKHVDDLVLQRKLESITSGAGLVAVGYEARLFKGLGKEIVENTDQMVYLSPDGKWMTLIENGKPVIPPRETPVVEGGGEAVIYPNEEDQTK